MDANEPPIGDGSSRPYVELIKKAGLLEQSVPRQIWEIREPIHIEVGNGSLITIVPDKEFRVSVTNVGKDGRFVQYFSSVVNQETYEKEIAPARTFTFYEDIKPLLDKGLIKGGSLENAVVVRGEEIMSKEPMRFNNEFARHKALDLIGDLMLSGKKFLGHVIAIAPGHGPNTGMAALIKKEYAAMRSMVPPLKLPEGEAVLKTEDILTMNEEFFQGHFPGHPIMPGVLQLEAMAQTASILIMRLPDNHGKIGYFLSANNVKFRKPVVPGDTLFIDAEITKMRRNIGQAIATCSVNGVVVSSAELRFAVM